MFFAGSLRMTGEKPRKGEDQLNENEHAPPTEEELAKWSSDWMGYEGSRTVPRLIAEVRRLRAPAPLPSMPVDRDTLAEAIKAIEPLTWPDDGSTYVAFYMSPDRRDEIVAALEAPAPIPESRRVQELLDASNGYLERAREAETMAADLSAQIRDTVAELKATGHKHEGDTLARLVDQAIDKERMRVEDIRRAVAALEARAQEIYPLRPPTSLPSERLSPLDDSDRVQRAATELERQWYESREHTPDTWRNVAAAVLAAADEIEEPEACFACLVPFKDGDKVYSDVVNGGTLHADCCGGERESFTNAEGEPLGPDEPIPEPWTWTPDTIK